MYFSNLNQITGYKSYNKSAMYDIMVWKLQVKEIAHFYLD